MSGGVDEPAALHPPQQLVALHRRLPLRQHAEEVHAGRRDNGSAAAEGRAAGGGVCHARPAFQLGWEKGAREIGHSLVVRAQSGRRLDVGHSRAIQRANDTKSGAV